MRKLTKLWAGLSATFAVLLSVTLIGSNIANQYSDVLNDALGLQTTITVPDPNAASVDTEYYKTSFGDGQFNEANLKLLAEFTKKQTQDEMREGAALLYNRTPL